MDSRDREDLLRRRRSDTAARTRQEGPSDPAARRLLEIVEQLSDDFRYLPEQVGHYLLESVSRGEIDAAAIQLASARLRERHGEPFAAAAFGLRSPQAKAAGLASQPEGTSVASKDLAQAQVVDTDPHRADRTRALLPSLAAALSLPLPSVQVRVDDVARRKTADLGANGVMDGGVVYLRPESYDPSSSKGRALLAHEVAHVAQRQAAIAGSAGLERGAAAAEVEAASLGRGFAEGAALRAPRVGLSSSAIAADKGAEGTKTGAEGGRAVNRYARVGPVDPFLAVRRTRDPRPVNTKQPQSDPLVVKSLVFNDRVLVLEEFPKNWVRVFCDDGSTGFVDKNYLFVGAPEPDAKLYKIRKGDTALGIAQREYHCGEWGKDGRYYVNVLVHVNKGDGKPDRGIYKEEAGASWKDARLVADRWIWIPGTRFADTLRAVVDSGSISYDLVQGVKGAAGFVVGVVEGFVGSLVDLVMGLVELLKLQFEALQELSLPELLGSTLLGPLGPLAVHITKKLSSLTLEDLVAAAKGLWADFEQRWNAPDAWDRWNFRGYVIGYAIAEILLLLVTSGGALGAKITGRVGKVAKALGEVTEVAKLGKRIAGSKAAQKLKTVLSKSKVAVEARGAVSKIATRLGIDMKSLTPARGSKRVFQATGAKAPAAHEVALAERIAAEVGEDVVLARLPNQPAVDGFLKATGKPLQLKSVTSSSPSKIVARANEAFQSASKHGWSGVQVYVEAPNLKKADILARWGASGAVPAPKAGMKGVLERIRVFASDGNFDIPLP